MYTVGSILFNSIIYDENPSVGPFTIGECPPSTLKIAVYPQDSLSKTIGVTHLTKINLETHFQMSSFNLKSPLGVMYRLLLINS
jgi:hypothetical protein